MADAPTAYCVKCREKREIKDPVEVTMKNGRHAVKGTCPVCGTALFRIGGGSGAESAAAEGASSSGAKAGSGGAKAGSSGGGEDKAASGAKSSGSRSRSRSKASSASSES